VTYGTTPASFLVTACLNKLVDSEFKVHPEACIALKRDFCVDDFLSEASTVKDAMLSRNQLILLLKSAGFELRKWISNDPVLLSDTPDKENVHMQILDLENSTTKIYGLIWNTKNDVFHYNINKIESNKINTKRTILTTISTIFDPLGFIGPFVVRANLMMQDLWKL